MRIEFHQLLGRCPPACAGLIVGCQALVRVAGRSALQAHRLGQKRRGGPLRPTAFARARVARGHPPLIPSRRSPLRLTESGRSKGSPRMFEAKEEPMTRVALRLSALALLTGPLAAETNCPRGQRAAFDAMWAAAPAPGVGQRPDRAGAQGVLAEADTYLRARRGR